MRPPTCERTQEEKQFSMSIKLDCEVVAGRMKGQTLGTWKSDSRGSRITWKILYSTDSSLPLWKRIHALAVSWSINSRHLEGITSGCPHPVPAPSEGDLQIYMYHLKNDCWVFFYNLKQALSSERRCSMARNVLIFLACKCTCNSPPHLSRDATLPDNTLATK